MSEPTGFWARAKRALRGLGEIDQATTSEGFRDQLKWIGAKVKGLFVRERAEPPPKDEGVEV